MVSGPGLGRSVEAVAEMTGSVADPGWWGWGLGNWSWVRVPLRGQQRVFRWSKAVLLKTSWTGFRMAMVQRPPHKDLRSIGFLRIFQPVLPLLAMVPIP